MSTIDASANIGTVPSGRVPAPSEQRSSPLVRQAFAAIDVAATVDQVKKILAEWTGLAAYARKAKDTQLAADAAEIRMRAERRLGEMMRVQKEAFGLHQGGRPKTGSDGDPVSEPKGTLAEAGIDKHLADAARKEAAKSEEQFEKDVAEKKSGILTRKAKTVNPKPLPDVVDGCIKTVSQRIQDTVLELQRRKAAKSRADLARLFAGLADIITDIERGALPAKDIPASAEKRRTGRQDRASIVMTAQPEAMVS